MKNVKSIFFVATLLILIVGLSAISATDANNDTSSITQKDVVSDVNVEKVSDTPVTETITKNNKEVKKDEDEHTITYNNTTVNQNIALGKNFSLNIINSTLKGYISGNGNNTINIIDSTIERYIGIQDNTTLNVINSTLNGYISNNGNNANITINNSTLYSNIGMGKYGNLTIINSMIRTYTQTSGYNIINISNSTLDYYIGIGDYSNITVSNSTLYEIQPGKNNSIIIFNNTTLDTINNNQKTTNISITDTLIYDESSTRLTNSGNLFLGNKTIIKSNYSATITNSGTLTITENVTFNTTSRVRISNTGILNLDENLILPDNVLLAGKGTLNVTNLSAYFKYYNGTWQSSGVVDLQVYTTNLNNNKGNLTVENSTMINNITNTGRLTFINTTIDSNITNTGTLIISDDSIIGENFYLTGSGEIIINDTHRIAEFLNIYNGEYTLTNKTLDSQKTNLQNLTLIECNITKKLINEGKLNLTNCILNSTINNTGVIYIDDDTIIGENTKIIGLGEIITNDITRLLPYIETISGNYTIKDTTLNKTYNFNGNVTLENCNITSTNNNNYGILNLTNTNITIDDESTWITNYKLLIIDDNINTTGITNYGELYTRNLPENYNYDPTYHIINNDTAKIYFDTTRANNLTVLVKEGDTLDFQGTISGVTGLTNLVISKPVNIITSTNDGRIENFKNITYNNGASGSNVTGLYTYNTQFYVYNSHNIVFDNISNVVNSSGIGSGVGQTSIRANSTNITIQNSYFYTKDNGGSSTFVFAWADNSTLINSTIQADGNVGNLVYLTTYNVNIPSGTIANSNNHIINNTIIGPQTPSAICWAIVLSGVNNTIDSNTIYYKGCGVVYQWGSGVDGTETDMSLVTIDQNTIINNKFYNGSGIGGGNFIQNNYVEKGNITAQNAYITNNTVFNLFIAGGLTEISGNTITNELKVTYDPISNALVENNTINKIKLQKNANNIKFNNNNITNLVEINGTNINFTNNNITTENDYTIIGTGTNNIITNNHLIAKTTYGDESVQINNQTNTIFNNTPTLELIIETNNYIPGQTTTLTANIYFDNKILSKINTGKIVFKVNGKTLKDENGKVIYAKVVNGTATIENYTVPEDWTKEGTTIQATYSGSTQCAKLTSEKTEITIQKEELTITTNDITTTTGSTVTLTATLNDNTINNGKIVFKVNGKTVKDENGKTIYAKVVNGQVSMEYTLPENMKAGSYTITATFIAPGYDKLEANSTMTVVKV